MPKEIRDNIWQYGLMAKETHDAFIEQVFLSGLENLLNYIDTADRLTVYLEGVFSKTIFRCYWLYDEHSKKWIPGVEFARSWTSIDDPDAEQALCCYVERDKANVPHLFLAGCSITMDLPNKMARDVIAKWPSDPTLQKEKMAPKAAVSE